MMLIISELPLQSLSLLFIGVPSFWCFKYFELVWILHFQIVYVSQNKFITSHDFKASFRLRIFFLKYSSSETVEALSYYEWSQDFCEFLINGVGNLQHASNGFWTTDKSCWCSRISADSGQRTSRELTREFPSYVHQIILFRAIKKTSRMLTFWTFHFCRIERVSD